MSHSYGEARPIGRMVIHAARQEPPAPATCARCACRLSRYRDHADGAYCAPCKATIKTEAEQRIPVAFKRNPQHQSSALLAQDQALSRTERRCTCGKPLHRDTKGTKCRACYEDATGRPTRRCHDCAKPIPKSNKSGLCQACYYWNRDATRPTPAACPDCGGPKSRNASCCRRCADKRLRRPEHVCPDCGGHKPLKGAILCRKCRDRAGGARNAHLEHAA